MQIRYQAERKYTYIKKDRGIKMFVVRRKEMRRITYRPSLNILLKNAFLGANERKLTHILKAFGGLLGMLDLACRLFLFSCQ